MNPHRRGMVESCREEGVLTARLVVLRAWMVTLLLPMLSVPVQWTSHDLFQKLEQGVRSYGHLSQSN